jgi:hypothetical protein
LQQRPFICYKNKWWNENCKLLWSRIYL